MHVLGVEVGLFFELWGMMGTVPSKRVGVHEPRHQKRLIG